MPRLFWSKAVLALLLGRRQILWDKLGLVVDRVPASQEILTQVNVIELAMSNAFFDALLFPFDDHWSVRVPFLVILSGLVLVYVV